MKIINLALCFGVVFYEVYSKVIVIGDLHSDYKRSIETFKLAGVINSKLKWIASNNTVIQTGDILDRGDGTFKLLKFLMKLDKKARAKKGRYIQLLGNHELMNMQGDTSHVKKKDFVSFGGKKKRSLAFSKTGWVGKYLRSLDIAAQIGRTVYVHGGINPVWARHKVAGLNGMNRNFLRKDSRSQLKSRDLYSQDKKKQTPLWYRGFSTKTHKTNCVKLERALRILSADRMVVGHTPTEKYEIEERCKGRVLIIDTNISRNWTRGGSTALVLTKGKTVALRAKHRPRILTTATK